MRSLGSLDSFLRHDMMKLRMTILAEPAAWQVWIGAGQPAQDQTATGVCVACGKHTSGALWSAYVRPTFMDFDKLSAGTILCQACQFAFDEQSDVLALRAGKDKPQRMRNYSHIVTNGQWFPLGKDQKQQMCDLLLDSAWTVAVIAVSGQKHLLFRARPGLVQFEEQVIGNIGGLRAMLPVLADGLAVFSKTEIESGDYRPDRIARFGLAEWRAFEERARLWRGGLLFALGLFLAQRKECDGQGGIDRARAEHRPGGVEWHTGGLQEPLPNLDLAAV